MIRAIKRPLHNLGNRLVRWLVNRLFRSNLADIMSGYRALSREFVKNYPVMLALTKNPKTPVALSMNLLPRLNDKDLRMLSTDRNVPEILRVTARKKIVIDK